MRALIVLVLVAACGPSAEEQRLQAGAGERNDDAADAAVDALMRARGLTPIERPQPVREDETSRAAPIVRGRGDGTTELVALPGSLAVAEMSCAPHMHTSCGCNAPLEYRYFRDASGTTVVVKLVPELHVRRVDSWSCTMGCGHHVLPPKRRLRALGAIDPAQVEVVDVSYRYDRVDEICHSGILAP